MTRLQPLRLLRRTGPLALLLVGALLISSCSSEDPGDDDDDDATGDDDDSAEGDDDDSAAAAMSPDPVRARYDLTADSIELSWTASGTGATYTVEADLGSGAVEVCTGKAVGCSVEASSGGYGEAYATWTVTAHGIDGSQEAATGRTDSLHLVQEIWAKETTAEDPLPFGTAAGEFNTPVGIHVGGDRVWVAEQQNHRVQVFTLAGLYQGNLPSGWTQPIGSSEEGELNAPRSVAFTEEQVLVADYANHRIQPFNADTWAAQSPMAASTSAGGEDDGELKLPTGVAVAPDGTIHITEAGNSRITILDGKGSFVLHRSAVGGEALNSPASLVYLEAIDRMAVADGGSLLLYATQSGDEEVMDLLADDSPSSLGSPCLTAFGEFLVPIDGGTTTAGSDGHRLAKVSSDGDEIQSIGGWGVEESQFFRPTACASLPSGDFLVTDALNHRVVRLGP